MEPTTGLVSGNKPGQQLFAIYGHNEQSLVLPWLPIFLGLIASAIVAIVFSPVPRATFVSVAEALLLALAYVFVTVAIGAGVFSVCSVIARHKREAPIWKILPFFCCVAAWIAPLVAFYARDSFWAVLTGLVLSILSSRLIYRYHLANPMTEMFTSSAQPRTVRPHSTRIISLSLTAVLLEFGALSTVASMARPATLLIGCAVIVISFFYHATNPSPLKPRFPKAQPSSITLGLAIILVAASLTPYLEVPIEGATDRDASSSGGHSLLKSGSRSEKARQSAALWFRRFLTHNSQSGAHSKRIAGASADHPYPALQALFGEGNTAGGSESTDRNAKSQTRKPTALVAGDSEPGVILRPKVTDHVTIVPPSPMRRVFDAKPSWSTTDPVSIPFYGAYWIFKTSDKTLPAGAIDVRGDPDSIVFKTTDFSSISMEARQNFGSPIQLSCCGAIELVISNADRRPGTVRVELILTNTILPGQPRQSLGSLPVNSTLHWFPGDDRPPVTEVLSFRLPAQPAIQSFDEATIRFEMGSPRERWSAKIAVQRFRLIPRLF
ncbi:MAG TPA: hypothetical protein VJP02_12520 [Candidatus Sulfotelmatobacter sp.]|nr:hypothetical protein [Candidatus Sulfotelmatobacter sp.]